MCDFSLMHAQSRPAKVAEKLVTKNFGTGTTGFVGIEESDFVSNACTAVCVLPGTELAFDSQVKLSSPGWNSESVEGLTARFRQIDKDQACTHHDALEFADGRIVKLTLLMAGQAATVLQLPAAPKTEIEAQEQKRLEIVA